MKTGSFLAIAFITTAAIWSADYPIKELTAEQKRRIASGVSVWIAPDGAWGKGRVELVDVMVWAIAGMAVVWRREAVPQPAALAMTASAVAAVRIRVRLLVTFRACWLGIRRFAHQPSPW